MLYCVIMVHPGSAIATSDTGSIYAPVWMTPEGDKIFAVSPSFTGGYLQVYHMDTESWEGWGRFVGTVLALAGVSDDVTMVESDGNIKRLDNDLGTIESIYNTYEQDSPPFSQLGAAWINPADRREVFASDQWNADIYHFNGTEWANMNAGISSGTSIFAITGRGGRRYLRGRCEWN